MRNSNFKKLTALVLALCMVFACMATANAKTVSNNIRVRVNGQSVDFTGEGPYVDKNGRTMIPLRLVSENLGADVEWIQATKTVVISGDDVEIRVPIGSKNVQITYGDETETVTMDTEAVIKNGTTMVPVRFVSEALGAYVDWTNTYTNGVSTVNIYQDELNPVQIDFLQSFEKTEIYKDILFDEDGKLYDFFPLVVDAYNASIADWAASREYRFHYYTDHFEKDAESEYARMIDRIDDFFYEASTDEIEFEFIGDTSMMYQPMMTQLGVMVRGIARVYVAYEDSTVYAWPDQIEMMAKLLNNVARDEDGFPSLSTVYYSGIPGEDFPVGVSFYIPCDVLVCDDNITTTGDFDHDWNVADVVPITDWLYFDANLSSVDFPDI